jgi:3-oxoadipate enol-lactonase
VERFSCDGVSLGYRDTGGTGVPVALVHAFPFSSAMWERQIEALRRRWRVIAPDLKGFGESDAPDDPSLYTIDSYADELHSLLRHLGVPSAVVVGLSLGGYVALALQRRHPKAIHALVLADTRAEADAPEVIERRTKQQREALEQGTAGVVEALSGALLAPATRRSKPDVVAQVRSLMEQPRAGYVGALEAMKRRPDATPLLRGISVPTLVVVGEHDGITPPDVARRLHEAIPRARLVVIPHAGHLANLEAPDAFDAALVEFLSDI